MNEIRRDAWEDACRRLPFPIAFHARRCQSPQARTPDARFLLLAAVVLFLAVYFAVDPSTYRRGTLLLLPPAARARVDSRCGDPCCAEHTLLGSGGRSAEPRTPAPPAAAEARLHCLWLCQSVRVGI